MADEFKIITAYIVMFIFFVAEFILLAMIIHLIHTAFKKKASKSTANQVMFMIAVTLGAIFSFFISVGFIIAIVVQVILLDAHALDPSLSAIDDFYTDSYDYLHYLVQIFDQFGHLFMVHVFVYRLKMCFANSIFGYSNYLIHILYLCEISLFFVSLFIIFQIISGQDVEIVIFCEIIWEILVEVICLWLLYLFVSKLHELVRNALGTHHQSRRDLRMTISYNISEKTASHHRDRSTSRVASIISPRTSRGTSRTSRFSVNQNSANLNDQNNKERTPSPVPVPPSVVGTVSPATSAPNSRPQSPSPSPIPDNASDAGDAGDAANSEITTMTSFPPYPTTTTTTAGGDGDGGGGIGGVSNSSHLPVPSQSTINIRNSTSFNGSSTDLIHDTATTPPAVHGQPQLVVKPNQTVLNNQNLVNVMTKMTLLVVFAVIGSLFTVIGNIYVQIHAMDNIVDDGTADITQMWGFLLPIFDMCLASITLYLQFDFTKGIYSKLCTKMDILFIQICGDLLDNDITEQQLKVKATTNGEDGNHGNNDGNKDGDRNDADSPSAFTPRSTSISRRESRPRQRSDRGQSRSEFESPGGHHRNYSNARSRGSRGSIKLSIDTNKAPVMDRPASITPVAEQAKNGNVQIRSIMESKFRERRAKSYGADSEQNEMNDAVSPVSPTPSDQVMGVNSTAVVKPGRLNWHLSAESVQSVQSDKSNQSKCATPPVMTPVDSTTVNPPTTPKEEARYWD